MNRVIYKNKDNSVSMLIPPQEVLNSVGIKAIAEKDVPQDLPYWFCSDTDIPNDRTFRDAWEIDESFGSPDGFGGESNEFSDEQLLVIYISKFIAMLKFLENETVVEHITNNKDIYVKIGLLFREFQENNEVRLSIYETYFDIEIVKNALIMVDNTLDMEINNDSSK